MIKIIYSLLIGLFSTIFNFLYFLFFPITYNTIKTINPRIKLNEKYNINFKTLIKHNETKLYKIKYDNDITINILCSNKFKPDIIFNSLAKNKIPEQPAIMLDDDNILLVLCDDGNYRFYNNSNIDKKSIYDIFNDNFYDFKAGEVIEIK